MLKVFPEPPELSFVKIIQIALVGIGFPFERNPEIGLVRIFQSHQPIVVLDNVEEVKENNQHLHLLPQMDFFVIHQYVIFLIFGVPNEDKREKSNAVNF